MIVPSDEHMRETAERFLSNEDRTITAAKHLAHYALELLAEVECVRLAFQALAEMVRREYEGRSDGEPMPLTEIVETWGNPSERQVAALEALAGSASARPA